jgi:hypothetical protein
MGGSRGRWTNRWSKVVIGVNELTEDGVAIGGRWNYRG